MASRPVTRLNLDEGLAARMSARSVRTARDVLLLSPLDLGELADISPAQAAALLRHVSAVIFPTAPTVLSMRQAGLQAFHLPTHLPALDGVLHGGVAPGAVCELVGPAGVGKTQLCLQLTASAIQRMLQGPSPVDQAAAGSVVYVDTERKFSPSRLMELAAARFPATFGPRAAAPTAALKQLGERVLVITPDGAADLLARIQGMERVMISQAVRLLVLDSVAAVARSDFGSDRIVERQQLLGQQAAALKYLAEAFRIPVVVTNQVMGAGFGNDGGGGSGVVTAALGTVWAHAANTRLVLEIVDGVRYVRVAKSPSAPNVAFGYHVTRAGLEQLGGPAGEGVAAPTGSVVGMHIHHDVRYEP